MALGQLGPAPRPSCSTRETSPDVRGYTGRYLAVLSEEPGGWMTWYARRIGGGLGRAAQRAAEQTAAHAGTPTRTWFDPLGRTFLTVAHNRVPDGGRLVDQYLPDPQHAGHPGQRA